jgi:predicted O-linked N-acetylglucosamine transferase (SPINDLY family)
LLYDAGKTEEAAGHYRKAIEIDPADAEGHFNLGNTLKALKQPHAAIESYEKALRIGPESAHLHNNLGNALQGIARTDEAVTHYRKAIAIDPGYAQAHNNLGLALAKKGDPQNAAGHFRKAIQLRPDYAEAHNNLGNALREQGILGEAVIALRHAVELKPDSSEFHNNLGALLVESGELSEALEKIKQAIALDGNSAQAQNNLGGALQAQGRLSEAATAYKKAIAIDPEYAEAHSHLGVVLYRSGKLPEAIAAYRRALALKPDYRDARSSLLYSLHYRPALEPVAMLGEHRRFAERHAQPLARHIRPHTNAAEPERVLRVGYVSPDFREHSVAYFIEAILRAHDRAAFEIFCYANVTKPDAVTERLKGLGHRWCDIAYLSDEQVAGRIREDEVDILVDLTGHTGENCLLVFARKPAPVQISYLGYPNTTGLTTIDYRITDAWADPPGQTERFHTEELVRLPDGFLCYQPPQESPDVTGLPAKETGRITFASFNNASKVGAEVIALWSDILHAVPSARLIMKAPQLSDPGVRRYFESLFEQQRISPAQIELRGPILSSVEHLAMYQEVDIALDPFPYNGTTTSCEALWMGVPVIALAGKTHAARVGVSLLSSVGLPELIAQTPAAYVEQALALAGDLERLAALREGLRHKMQQSPLTHATRFTRSLESVYRGVWRKYCEELATCHI